MTLNRGYNWEELKEWQRDCGENKNLKVMKRKDKNNRAPELHTSEDEVKPQGTQQEKSKEYSQIGTRFKTKPS